jgi:molecular chaperone DnaJ
MAKRDYYEVLGVPKTANKTEIKSAYRKLAKTYHPDRNKAADAETKFKEVQEAYEILSDEQKRSAYDKYGHAGTQGFGGGGFSGASYGGFDFNDLGGIGDIFEQFFGGGFGGFGFGSQRSNAPARGQDIEVTLKIDFNDAVFGTQKTIRYDRRLECKACKGTGAKGGKVKTCPTCGGQGRVNQVQRTILGNMQTVITCPTCHGSGDIASEVCPVCNGKGTEQKSDTFTIKIPQGIPDDVTLRFPEHGHAGKKGGKYGDLYVNIEVASNDRLERRGNDIYTDLTIDVTTAVLGGDVEVATVHGEDALKIPAGTQPETVLKMKTKGGPKFKGTGNGDQYVKILVKIPAKLNKEQRQLWQQLSETKDQKGFFANLF